MEALRDNAATAQIGSDGGLQWRAPRLVGGRLCLDFANTMEGRGGARPGEFLRDYADLVAWGMYAGAIPEGGAARLTVEANRRPEQAAAAYRRAVDFRETLYRVFSAIAAAAPPAAIDLDALRRADVAGLHHARLALTGGGFAYAWPAETVDLDRILWPVARSALDLLTAGDLGRLKECPGGGGGPCTWLFVDASKNAVRRWCSMAECGGEAKARRQTSRRRAARTASNQR